ncbi:MAG: HEPN domain-containing protein [Chloroflexi bacterium]|nr:HEPN domain-containing protein [Chloroflexota bacterium]MDA1296740.1 HEPN domain-containing protein [Chloroflexota bacterium]
MKVGEYVRLIKPDTSYGKSFRFQGYAGAEAAVTTAAQEDIRRAVEAVANQHLAPQVYVALNWYDQSKRAETGADRLVALWIALEALMSIERSRGKLDTKAARFLSSEAFSLGIKTDRIHEALGLGEMRRLRNRIVHLAYPVAYSGYNIWCR